MGTPVGLKVETVEAFSAPLAVFAPASAWASTGGAGGGGLEVRWRAPPASTELPLLLYPELEALERDEGLLLLGGLPALLLESN